MNRPVDSSGGPRRGPRPRSVQPPSLRARRTDLPRETAYQVLRAVDEDGAYANLQLPKALRQARLRGRDAGFATELCYGTIRMQGSYDAVIDAATEPGRDRIDPAVRDILRLGVHQLWAMRVPDHAAVSSSVALARQLLGAGAGGFVNAVLRRISERDQQEWLSLLTEPMTDPVDRLALRYSHPAWVVRALRAALLGHHAATATSVQAELTELLASHNEPAPVILAARPGLVTEEELSERADPDPVAPTAWRLRGGDPGGIAAVREQRAGVQDGGSQLVALAVAAAVVPGDEGRLLDLCAGPGGKAALLGAVVAPGGARLVANEMSTHRADLVRQAVAPVIAAGGLVEVRQGDGRLVGQEHPAAYDRVLVDAPCTGLGSLRRRPEARWRHTPSDLATLGPLQRELLSSALQATRPGGIVVYATCSPHPAETTYVVEDVSKTLPGVSLEDVRPLLRDRAGAAVPDTGPGPSAQLWPHRHGTDGMFVALLRRTG